MSQYTVRLARTIAAVREALPEDEVAEFNAAMETTDADAWRQTFDYWFPRAVLNKAGLLERIKAGERLASGSGVGVDEAFPGLRERWEQERAQHAA